MYLSAVFALLRDERLHWFVGASVCLKHVVELLIALVDLGKCGVSRRAGIVTVRVYCNTAWVPEADVDVDQRGSQGVSSSSRAVQETLPNVAAVPPSPPKSSPPVLLDRLGPPRARASR